MRRTQTQPYPKMSAHSDAWRFGIERAHPTLRPLPGVREYELW